MFRIRLPLRPFQLSPRLPPLNTHIPTRAYRQQRFTRPQYKRFSASSNIYTLFTRWAARPTFYRDVGLISLGSGAFYVYNLERVPVSNRQRFNIIPPSLEERIGRSTVEQVKQEYAGQILDEHDKRVQQVKRVLARLLPFAKGEGLEGLDWEVFVIDAPEQNAFVVPGGKVFVFTGILPLCGDEAGVAAVLGHELAHVVAHHTAERLSAFPLLIIPLAATLVFDVSFYTAKMLLDLFLSMPASRKHEAEADYIGLMMMAQGCYNPEAAMLLWNRMEKLGQAAPPQILSTHPSNHNREEKIRGWLPEARELAEKSECFVTGQYAEQFGSAFGNFSRW